MSRLPALLTALAFFLPATVKDWLPGRVGDRWIYDVQVLSGDPKHPAVEEWQEEVVTTAIEATPSGLVFKSLVDGTGASPKATSTVKVNYKGSFVNGNKFDASADHGGPISFPLNRVIKCWTEGVQRIKVGGKAKLTCPSALAYGPAGAGSDIPPNTTLVFEVELLSVN